MLPKSLLQASGVSFIALVVIRLRFVENILDAKFLLGINLPFQLYKAAVTRRNGGQPSNRTLEVRENCNEIASLIYSAQHPVLFKKCLLPNATVEDFMLFKHLKQNLFPPCGGEKLLRHFEYQNFRGEKKQIIEDVPCNPSTLQEKIDSFHEHDLHSTESEDRAYFEVHTYMMTKKETMQMQQRMSAIMPFNIGMHENMIPAVITAFLHAGRSAVYYLHAHPDHFISFCLSAEKTWVLIDPLYSDSFKSTWSRNAQVMLQELDENVPRIVVKQEKGDILYVPPWWIHETVVKKTAKNLGFNLHYGVRGQAVMELVNLALRFGYPSFFYSNVKQIKPEHHP